MKQKQLNSSERYIPTFEEIAENKRMIEICLHYGIRINYFADKDILTTDEIKALKLIMSNKNIPLDLANRLLETKSEREQQPTISMNQISEEEAFKLFGIKHK